MLHHARRLAVVAILASTFMASAWAEFKAAPEVPVERLIANLTAHLVAHPADHHARYLLGRIHALAYVNRTEVLRAWERETRLPELDFWQLLQRERPPMDDAAAQAHLVAAIREYRAVLASAPDEAAYHLGLAWILEHGAPVAPQLGLPPGDARDGAVLDEKRTGEIEALLARLDDASFEAREAASKALREQLLDAAPWIARRARPASLEVVARTGALLSLYWTEQAITGYARAFELSQATDGKLTQRPLRGLTTLVSHEAATTYLKLVAARGATDAERPVVDAMRDHLARLETIPTGKITPIVFALDGARPLDALLEPRRTASFDLRGDGIARTWPWLAPRTGLLVWDPRGTGRVRSGRDLFGSVSWWMFWSDGYAAMAALDDDRDGELAERELVGLAAWFDQDGDGRSGRGEVVPLGRLGVAALSVRATGRVGDSPCNPRGLRMADGRILPTYDWVTELAPTRP